jgi:hypothetical protein
MRLTKSGSFYVLKTSTQALDLKDPTWPMLGSAAKFLVDIQGELELAAAPTAHILTTLSDRGSVVDQQGS